MSSIKWQRRKFLSTTTLATASILSTRYGLAQDTQSPPLITRDTNRAQFVSGVQSGDVEANRAIVWARADRDARLWVQWDTTDQFRSPRNIRGPYAMQETDHTARLDLTKLPSDQHIFYRIKFEDIGNGSFSETITGHFKTAATNRKNLRFVWSGDTAGQGWGINLEQGGMSIYEAMRKRAPDFFIHCGDNIYADGIIKAEVEIKDGPLKGTIWKNVITEEKSKVAETLKEFRGAYRYNMLDENIRRFNQEVPQIWQWDDHEVTNNWSSAKDLSQDDRYKEKRVPLLIARGTRAFLENAPMRWHSQTEEQRVYRKISQGPLLDVFVIDMRSYRGPNSYNRQETINEQSQYLGAEQIAWLKRELKASTAVWKVIASDMPLGLEVDDGKDSSGKTQYEAVANGDGPPLGRELEIADILRNIKREKIRNTVWLTADTHYTAAHFYDPAKAVFQDFDPFWEFMTGPLSSGTFGPNKPDNTFGIQVKFQKAPDAGRVNLSPAEGMQFFGEVQIDAKTADLKVDLRDMAGESLWATTLTPSKS